MESYELNEKLLNNLYDCISKDGKTKIYDLKTNYLPKNSGYIGLFIKAKERASKKIILNNQYLFLNAISFSNYGGIYLCKNLENNHKYILKESRFNDENSIFYLQHYAIMKQNTILINQIL